MPFGFINAALRRLRRETLGTMVVETAIVAPVLALLSIGVYDAGRIFERQTSLQSAIGEVTSIVLAANSGATTSTTTVQDILHKSTGLPDSQIAVSKMYRCGDSTTLVSDSSTCSTSDQVSTYLLVTLTDSYSPMWVALGIGKQINYSVTRTAQIA